jgi:hypothetical protein
LVGHRRQRLPGEETGGGRAEVVALDVSCPTRHGGQGHLVEKQGSARPPDIGEAAIVVAGGRGLGNEDGFELMEQLADVLGAGVGASRAATDAGWYPHRYQIGQTGRTISPTLYIGSGISGAIQHRAGMQTSQHIVAINKDAEAPIFQIADFGIVGDLYKVVPKLIEELEARKCASGGSGSVEPVQRGPRVRRAQGVPPPRGRTVGRRGLPRSPWRSRRCRVTRRHPPHGTARGSSVSGERSNTSIGVPAAAQTTVVAEQMLVAQHLQGVSCPNGGVPPIA